MDSNQSIVDTIRKRISVRTYSEQKISDEVFDQISNILGKYEAEVVPLVVDRHVVDDTPGRDRLHG